MKFPHINTTICYVGESIPWVTFAVKLAKNEQEKILKASNIAKTSASFESLPPLLKRIYKELPPYH